MTTIVPAPSQTNKKQEGIDALQHRAAATGARPFEAVMCLHPEFGELALVEAGTRRIDWFLLKPSVRAFRLIGGIERSPCCGGILDMLLGDATRERKRYKQD